MRNNIQELCLSYHHYYPVVPQYLSLSLMAGSYSFCQPVECLLEYLFLLWRQWIAVYLRVGFKLDHLGSGRLLKVLGREDGLHLIWEGHVVHVWWVLRWEIPAKVHTHAYILLEDASVLVRMSSRIPAEFLTNFHLFSSAATSGGVSSNPHKSRARLKEVRGIRPLRSLS